MTRIDAVRTCLVTDRRRGAAGGEGPDSAAAWLIDQVRQAVAAGVDIVQVRERDLEAAALSSLVRAIVAVCRGSSTRVVVNDRLDVALACRADGVHLRADSVAPARARSIAPPGFLVGRSIHRIDEALDHQMDVDYFIAGTVFATVSKPGGVTLLGLKGLADLAQAAQRPVLAIGGVTEDRLAEIAATGASGVAGIGLFLPSARPLSAVVTRVRQVFDTPRADF